MIQSIELREIRLPLIHYFETSFGRTTERRIVLARVSDADGAEGWGEFTAGEGPFYSDEWTDSGWDTLCEFLGPMLLSKKFDSASGVFAARGTTGRPVCISEVWMCSRWERSRIL